MVINLRAPWDSPNVRFGSLADIAACLVDVRFTSESRHFVSPIEMPVYHWKLVGSGDNGDLDKD